MFIYGLPLDNYKSCLDTLSFSKRINATYSQFSIFTPYPGTPVYDTEYKNKILTKKFEDFTQWQLVFKHKNLSAENLKNLVKKSYKEYYLILLLIHCIHKKRKMFAVYFLLLNIYPIN